MNRALLLLLLLTLPACNRDRAERQEVPSGPPAAGNAARGRLLAAQYGCNVCHVIPGVEGPQGALGPSLAGVASRPRISYEAVENSPENMARYIQNPAAMNPQTTMPALGLAPQDANDIAAYLGTLK